MCCRHFICSVDICVFISTLNKFLICWFSNCRQSSFVVDKSFCIVDIKFALSTIISSYRHLTIPMIFDSQLSTILKSILSTILKPLLSTFLKCFLSTLVILVFEIIFSCRQSLFVVDSVSMLSTILVFLSTVTSDGLVDNSVYHCRQ